jgi:hypothetical protein
MARLPAAQANAAITAMFPTATTYYLALFTTDPSTTGASGEVTGGSYARQPINFAAPSGGTAVSGGSNPAQSFTNMPVEAGGIPYFGIFSAATAGTYEGGGTTSGLSGSIPAGATVSFAAGQVSVAVS